MKQKKNPAAVALGIGPVVQARLNEGWKFHGHTILNLEAVKEWNQPMTREVSVPTVEGYEVRG